MLFSILSFGITVFYLGLFVRTKLVYSMSRLSLRKSDKSFMVEDYGTSIDLVWIGLFESSPITITMMLIIIEVRTIYSNYQLK